MNKFFLLLLCLIAFTATQSKASSTVDGTVVAADTKKPIADVTIIAINPITKVEHSATTDAKGEFKIAVSTPGTYNIKFKKEDYISTEKNKLQVVAKTTQHINIEMSPILEEDDHHGWRNKGRYGLITMW